MPVKYGPRASPPMLSIKIKNALATALNLGKTSSVTVDAAQPSQAVEDI